jgi:NADH-quinone oxidoreductase subunit F
VAAAGLTECGHAGEPIHFAWRRFLRGHGASTLVIDATRRDDRELGTATVLDGAPWRVAEGVAIAAGLRDSERVELRLPVELTGHEAALLNAVDAIRSLARISSPSMRLDVVRGARPACWADGQPDDPAHLVHTPETWARIALLFAGVDDLDASLLTLRRGMRERGLTELSRTASLHDQLDTWGGGVEAQGEDPVLVFDDGLGGFLPRSASLLPSDPLALREAGVVPAPTSLLVLADGVCVVRQARHALYRWWKLAEGEGAEVRGLLARVARLTTEVTLGRGDEAHLAVLDDLALELDARGLGAAWPLASSLRHYRAQWEAHARRESCPEGECLELPNHTAPCHQTCPANIDIPSFIAHLGNGDDRATVAVIRRDNPFPLVCGLVCPAPCESSCLRGVGNGPVFIRTLKTKAAEHCLADGGYPRPEVAPDTGKRIGVIGAGPSSLTAAYYLRTYGHHVDVIEELEHAGGQLRYGIPAYRLPPDLLQQEIEQITALGVTIHTGVRIDDLEAFRRDYDAVFLGLGTQQARLIPVEGAHQPFVLGGLDFLHDVRRGKAVRVGPRVVVIGGGNVSIDVALTALRQGATHVALSALDKRRDLPASPHEIELAVAEGVQLYPSYGPVAIDQDGEVTFHFCERTLDDTGRFAPVFDDNRRLTLPADQVIFATGQGTDLGLLEGSTVENNRGFIVADPSTLMTTEPGVFAGGDAQHGPRTAVEAIRSGKIAAASIDAWLSRTPVDRSVGRPVRRDDVLPLRVDAEDRTHLPRAPMPERTVEEVLGEGNYVRIELGLSDQAAHDEARRCLRCDVCIGCGMCMAACSEMGIEALHMADTAAGRLAYVDFTTASACIGCGACTEVCPTGAIHFEDDGGLRRTVITGTVVQEQPVLACDACGAPTRTAAHREYLRERLPDHMAALLDRELCPACARTRGHEPWQGRRPVVAG